MKKLVVLTGPTAIGKTELSIRLAKAINGEIISADSIQVYKKMNIGSAKITPEEMQGIPHYLIDEFDPGEPFNVHIFQNKAKEYIDLIGEKGKIPIIAGGTGFYIQSVLYDIQFHETEETQEYRKSLETMGEEQGPESLYEMLQKVDPESAGMIHPNNVRRVIRALEYFHQTGEKISMHNQVQRQNHSPYQFSYFVLNTDRTVLYQRINRRVDQMIDAGLEEEVSALLSEGYDENLSSMQGIGYKEMIEYLKGRLGFEETVELIKKNTRHFAKRQLTWFRREKDVTMVDCQKFHDDKNEILEYLLYNLREKGIITNERTDEDV